MCLAGLLIRTSSHLYLCVERDGSNFRKWEETWGGDNESKVSNSCPIRNVETLGIYLSHTQMCQKLWRVRRLLCKIPWICVFWALQLIALGLFIRNNSSTQFNNSSSHSSEWWSEMVIIIMLVNIFWMLSTCLDYIKLFT